MHRCSLLSFTSISAKCFILKVLPAELLDALKEMDGENDNKSGSQRLSSTLGPPRLFQKIRPPVDLAGLPLHRRLCFQFCKSRAVLPANTRLTKTADAFAVAGQAHAETSGVDSTEWISVKPERHFDPHRRACAHACSLPLKCPQTHMKQEDSEAVSRLSSSDGNHKGRLLLTPDNAVIKEKQQKQRGRRGHRAGCADGQHYASLPETEDGARLRERLQSLGVEDNQKQPLHRNPGRLAGHQRSRRPHFLPPINQEHSLLIPENSSPPSSWSFPDGSVKAVPVQPLSQRRKSHRKLVKNAS